MPENSNLDLRSLAPSPINLTNLTVALSSYNNDEAEFLLDGFTNGFSLNYTGPRQPRVSKNLNSALQNIQIVQQKIDKELAAGRVAGPFKDPPLVNLQVSPIGLVPKKAPGEYRLIHHLSSPKDFSINDFIDPKLCSVQYTSFDEAVQMIQDLGQNCKLFKMDLKNAFRNLPVKIWDIELLGFKFEDRFYVDKCLPMGCSISCSHFERFSTFLEHHAKSKMSNGRLIHYLDDFLGGDKDWLGCESVMKGFEECLQGLSVPLATEKTEGPVEVLVFLGLELDSRQMVVRIPRQKIQEIVEKIRGILAASKTTLKAMQSLIGSLNFCCRAIVPGRPFCRRLINSICGLTKPHHHLRINKGIKLDLEMWLEFFENFNGISMFHDRFWVSSEDELLFTDSAAGKGFGIYFKGHWAYAEWPKSWHELGVTADITTLELFPIFVSLHIWGGTLVKKKIRFMCDNMAVVEILNHMTSKSDMVMVILRQITLLCLEHSIVIKARHIQGTKNVLCDALSRLQVDKFRSLAPQADPDPQLVPNFVWGIFKAE